MPGQAKNPGFADAAQREPRLESPDQPRWHNHLLEVRPESRAQKVWLYKQLFHAVKELVSPASSLTGNVMIGCLRINRGFSRGGDFLAARGLDNFLGTHDFPGRIAMHGEKNTALLQVAFVSLCFEFRDAHADQRAGNPAHSPPNAKSRQPCHDGTCGYEWA